MKDRIINLLTEFTMVFLGVLLAFFANDWAEQNRDEKYIKSIVANLVDDVKKDSTNIRGAINALHDQHDSLNILIHDLDVMNHPKANKNIRCTYFSYNAFEPTTATFESLIFGGDLKLLDDPNQLKTIKELEEINHKLQLLHDKYHATVESFRNTFIAQYNVEHFDFANVPPEQGIEFWNRLKFLNESVDLYFAALVNAQWKYDSFLKEFNKH